MVKGIKPYDIFQFFLVSSGHVYYHGARVQGQNWCGLTPAPCSYTVLEKENVLRNVICFSSVCNWGAISNML